MSNVVYNLLDRQTQSVTFRAATTQKFKPFDVGQAMPMCQMAFWFWKCKGSLRVECLHLTNGQIQMKNLSFKNNF